MIKGLFETHIDVTRLDESIEFYCTILGLKLAHFEAKRRVAFLWIENPGDSMLGLWEDQSGLFERRHFAFRCETNFVLHEAVPFLTRNGLQPYNFKKDGTTNPLVFAWMPAIAIYFKDPDGNELEFLSPLNDQPIPELGIITYDEWLVARSAQSNANTSA